MPGPLTKVPPSDSGQTLSVQSTEKVVEAHIVLRGHTIGGGRAKENMRAGTTLGKPEGHMGILKHVCIVHGPYLSYHLLVNPMPLCISYLSKLKTPWTLSHFETLFP